MTCTQLDTTNPSLPELCFWVRLNPNPWTLNSKSYTITAHLSGERAGADLPHTPRPVGASTAGPGLADQHQGALSRRAASLLQTPRGTARTPCCPPGGHTEGLVSSEPWLQLDHVSYDLAARDALQLGLSCRGPFHLQAIAQAQASCRPLSKLQCSPSAVQKLAGSRRAAITVDLVLYKSDGRSAHHPHAYSRLADSISMPHSGTRLPH